jgi:hypothetical protein
VEAIIDMLMRFVTCIRASPGSADDRGMAALVPAGWRVEPVPAPVSPVAQFVPYIDVVEMEGWYH